MNVLIIGFSSIVQRRVLPALISVPEIDTISIASRCALPEDVVQPEKRGKIFQGYENAITGCKPGLVYISLPNSMHAEWARRALDAGFHVIVDKPAVTNVVDARELVKIAEHKRLCLAEANVWNYHPLAQVLKDAIDGEENIPLMLTATFSSPFLAPDNFRYDSTLGGGALLDRGPYAVSCGRVLFGSLPQELECRIVPFDKKGEVDISFDVTMRYPNGSLLQGFFSLGAEYRNSISAIGASYCIDVDRIFSPPADYEGVVNVKRNNKTESIPIAPADTFALFIKDVLNSIHDGSFDRFSRILIEDVRVLDDLITSAGRE